MVNQKIKVEHVRFDPQNFSHLSENELSIIHEKMELGQSLCFKFHGENDICFYVVIDIDNKSVHVRRISGAFIFRWQAIYDLCFLICKKLELKTISVIADKNFMKFAVKKLNFVKVNGDYYEKRVA